MADVNLYTQQLSSNLLEREKEVHSLHLQQISNSVLKYDFTFSHKVVTAISHEIKFHLTVKIQISKLCHLDCQQKNKA